MTKKPSFWTTSQGVASIFLIGAVSYFLLMEHRAHLFYFLPFMILLLCPVMHIFMHKGHGHGGHKGNESEEGAIRQHPNLGEKEAYRRGIEEGRRQSVSDKPSTDRRQ
tara:strand:- start:22758 stop:23081 length:324 start_codon:yes stop_codon:yes gene_type:complete